LRRPSGTIVQQSETAAPQCRICENTVGNIRYRVREMMFGTKETFGYFQCSECNCLQMENIPSDLSDYYPANYYSIGVAPPVQFPNPIVKIFKNRRNHYAVFGKGIIGRMIYKRAPNEGLWPLSRIPLYKSMSLLDVGCGTGVSLYSLRELGFRNILGIDPYINQDINYQNGLRILKKSIEELGTIWDVIMFHHSFEHLPNPIESLQAVSRLLSKNGVCVVVLPVVSSYAWKQYGVNWVQLDAPRHLFLHSMKSLAIAAVKTGLQLRDVIYNSTAFQFWGSEQYLRDIPLMSDRSYWMNPGKSIFSKKEIKSYTRKAAALNREQQGDSAILYFVKGGLD